MTGRHLARALLLGCSLTVTPSATATGMLSPRVTFNLEASWVGFNSYTYDTEEGVGEAATGGRMICALPGARLSWDALSLGLGIKTAIWTNLNEEGPQQGAEGKEDYRIIFTASMVL